MALERHVRLDGAVVERQARGSVVAGREAGDLTLMARPQSQLGMTWRRLRRDRFALVGLAIIAVTVALALTAPIVSPYDPMEQNSKIRLQPIGTPGHALGTDGNGRDMVSRLIYGSRTALVAATVPVLIAAGFGLVMGLIAGYLGGWPDMILMRLADILFAFPAILLAIAIVAALGPSLVNAMMALAIVFIPAFARLVRSSVLSLRERDFVLSARASGATDGRIITRHILTNALSTDHRLRHVADRPNDHLCRRPLVPRTWRAAAIPPIGARWRTTAATSC